MVASRVLAGMAHWPTGDYGRYRAKPPRPAAPSEPVRVVTGVAMASKISDLSSELDD